MTNSGSCKLIWQGYLAVDFLALRAEYGLKPGGNVAFDPNLITADKAAQMVERPANGDPSVPGAPVKIPWFLGLAGVVSWILLRTPAGNWIFAAGGDADAAASSGVPVRRVKLTLFMVTAACAALLAIMQVIDAGTTDARRGFQKEFEAIIAAVIGGCLLTGRYGPAIGAFFGAIIFGMVVIGSTYTGFDQDWFQVFLGAMLLLAVIFNNAIRKPVTGER